MHTEDSAYFENTLLEDRKKRTQRAAEESSEVKVTAGSWVSIENLETGELHELRVVSTVRPGVTFDEVSSWSPVGKALMGRRVGESIHAEIPRGTVRYRILRIAE